VVAQTSRGRHQDERRLKFDPASRQKRKTRFLTTELLLAEPCEQMMRQIDTYPMLSTSNMMPICVLISGSYLTLSNSSIMSTYKGFETTIPLS
jgi:hypothetical protein